MYRFSAKSGSCLIHCNINIVLISIRIYILECLLINFTADNFRHSCFNFLIFFIWIWSYYHYVISLEILQIFFFDFFINSYFVRWLLYFTLGILDSSVRSCAKDKRLLYFTFLLPLAFTTPYAPRSHIAHVLHKIGHFLCHKLHLA